MKRVFVAVASLLMLAACQHTSQREGHAWDSYDLSRIEQIQEAVYRYELTTMPEALNDDAQVIFLSTDALGDDADPRYRLVSALGDLKLPLEPVSHSTGAISDGVRDRATKKRGIIWRAGPIDKRISPIAVDVKGGYYVNGTISGGSIYHVQRTGSRWAVIAETPRNTPQ